MRRTFTWTPPSTSFVVRATTFALLGLGSPGAHAQAIFSENFDLPVVAENAQAAVPAGWLIEDVDGRTPDPSVAPLVNAAWVRLGRPEQQTVAASTSWYAPEGAADDWLITPRISLGAASALSWVSQSVDTQFVDSFEVRISTVGTARADFLANPPLLVVNNENSTLTPHLVTLFNLGYANKDVYFAFRNITNNGYILAVDDVRVDNAVLHDLSVEGAVSTAGYTRIPLLLNPTLTGRFSVTNEGSGALTAIAVTGAFTRDGSPAGTVTGTPIATLAPTASAAVTLPPFTPSQTGEYGFTASANPTETDEVPANNTAVAPMVTITDNEWARDDGVVTSLLGIGAPAGEMGVVFDVTTEVRVTAVRAVGEIHSENPDGGTPGTTGVITAHIHLASTPSALDNPSSLVATSEDVTFTVDAQAELRDFPFAGDGVVLAPGRYFFGLEMPTGNESLGTADNIFSNDTYWVRWDGQTPATVESFGETFKRAFIIRVIVAPVTPSSSSSSMASSAGLASSSAGTTSGIASSASTVSSAGAASSSTTGASSLAATSTGTSSVSVAGSSSLASSVGTASGASSLASSLASPSSSPAGSSGAAVSAEPSSSGPSSLVASSSMASGSSTAASSATTASSAPTASSTTAASSASMVVASSLVLASSSNATSRPNSSGGASGSQGPSNNGGDSGGDSSNCKCADAKGSGAGALGLALVGVVAARRRRLTRSA
jgi:MYXO-CTERM domain-containing protein